MFFELEVAAFVTANKCFPERQNILNSYKDRIFPPAFRRTEIYRRLLASALTIRLNFFSAEVNNSGIAATNKVQYWLSTLREGL